MWCPKGVQKHEKVVIVLNPYPNLEGVVKTAKPEVRRKPRKSGVLAETVKNTKFSTFSHFSGLSGFGHS